MNTRFSRSIPQDESFLDGSDAEFVVRSGASEWRLTGGAAAGVFADVASEDPNLSVRSAAERIEVRHGSVLQALTNGFPWSFSSDTVVALADARRWAIDLRGGVSNLDADLRSVSLASIDVRGGVSGLVLALPEPDRVVPIRIHGGVQSVFVLRPAGVPFSVAIRGGATDLSLDRAGFGAVGGKVEWNLDLPAESGRGYQLEIARGVSTLTVGEGSGTGRAAGTELVRGATTSMLRAS